MKNDEKKTKEQLINELDGIRRRVAELEVSGAEHKQTAELLRVGERQFLMLFDNISDVIFIISIEPNDCYRFTMVNKRFIEVTGLSKAQVVGKLIQEVIPESAHALVLGKYREAIQTGRTTRWEEVSEYPAGKKTGEVTISPVFDVNNNCTHLIGTVHDITGSRLIEEELRQLNNRYETLFEKSNDGIIVLQDALVKFANSKAAEITGLSAEDVRGKQFIDFVAPQDRELVMERYLKRLLGEEIPSKYEMCLLNKDGSAISVEVNASLIEYDCKPATLSMVRDISERKKKEEQAKELQDREIRLSKNLQAEIDKRIELTRILVHELKTPLTPIAAASELLMDEIQEGPLFRLARSINKGTVTLGTRINQLLDVTKGELGILALDCRETDLLELLREIAEDMAPLASSRGQLFNLELPVPLPPVQIDEERLRQVIVNLLDNSFKFTPEGGKITLKAKKKDNTLVVEVEDTGPGLSADQKQYAFEAFNHASRKSPYGKGLGLGLALSKMLVELHGGKIWVETQEGQGSRFAFSVPLHS